MKISNETITTHQISDFKGGWYIGDFEPTLHRTQEFEVSVKKHPKGEIWPKHFHKIAKEYNYLISGAMTVNGLNIGPGELFIVPPNVSVVPTFHEDCEIVCVKVPGPINDKYLGDPV